MKTQYLYTYLFRIIRAFFFQTFLIISLLSCCFAQSDSLIIRKKPKPSWIKDYPPPNICKACTENLVLLHQEAQYHFAREEIFYRYFYYIRTEKGKNEIKSFSVSYEPSFEEVFLHEVIIHREGSKRKLDKELQIDNLIDFEQIGDSRYDEDAKMKVFLNEIKSGDIIELSASKSGHPPDLRGRKVFKFSVNEDEVYQNHLRIIGMPQKPIRTKFLNFELLDYSTSSPNPYTLEVNIRKRKSFNYTASPQWYVSSPTLFVFESTSWEELQAVNQKNYPLEKSPSPFLRNSTLEITQSEDDLIKKVNRIFDFLQNEISYRNYELIEPKKPDFTLKHRLGDCKSKTLLGIKMLEVLGVEAWPLIVSSTGLDDRLLSVYSGQIFDHVIMEYVLNGDTLFFDATQNLQKGSLEEKYISDHRYGLRVRKGQNSLVPLDYSPSDEFEIHAVLDFSEEFSTTMGKWTISFGGDIANDMDARFRNQGFQEVINHSTQNILMRYQDLTYSIEGNYNDSISQLSFSPLQKWEVLFEKISGDSLYYIARSLDKWLSFDAGVNPGSILAIADIKKAEINIAAKNPEDKILVLDSLYFEKDWIKYSKEVHTKNDSIYAHFSVEFLKTYIDSSRLEEVSEGLALLKDKSKLVFENKMEEKEEFRVLRNRLILLGVVLLIISALIYFIWKWRRSKQKYLARISELEKQLKDSQ